MERRAIYFVFYLVLHRGYNGLYNTMYYFESQRKIFTLYALIFHFFQFNCFIKKQLHILNTQIFEWVVLALREGMDHLLFIHSYININHYSVTNVET